MRLSRSVAGIRVRQWAAVPVLVAAAVVSASAQPAQGERPPLRVVSAAPGGELATLAEANEIRVVFSEPMIALGSVPARVTAPFFSVYLLRRFGLRRGWGCGLSGRFGRHLRGDRLHEAGRLPAQVLAATAEIPIGRVLLAAALTRSHD